MSNFRIEAQSPKFYFSSEILIGSRILEDRFEKKTRLGIVRLLSFHKNRIRPHSNAKE